MARRADRLEALAQRLREQHGVSAASSSPTCPRTVASMPSLRRSRASPSSRCWSTTLVSALWPVRRDLARTHRPPELLAGRLHRPRRALDVGAGTGLSTPSLLATHCHLRAARAGVGTPREHAPKPSPGSPQQLRDLAEVHGTRSVVSVLLTRRVIQRRAIRLAPVASTTPTTSAGQRGGEYEASPA